MFIAAMAMCVQISMFGQKIEKSQIDNFTGEKVVYTSWERIKMGKGATGENNLLFMFRHENNTNYLHLKWITAEILSVLDDARIMFKFNDNSIITLNSIYSVVASRGGGVNGLSWSNAIGLEAIYKGSEIGGFAKQLVVTQMRIYTTKGYVDIDLNDKDAQKINRAFQLLLSEVKK